MEISGDVARRKVRLIALRLLTMGLCATVLWTTQAYTLATSEQAYVCFILGNILLTLAAAAFAYSKFGSFPDEIVTLAPDLKLPNSLVKGGYDSHAEPLDYWLWQINSKNRIVVGTAKRQFQLSNMALTEEQWQRLTQALSAQRQLPTPKILKPIKLVFVAYAALLLACHFLMHGPSDFVFFNLLARGGYNAAAAAEGEVYRALSYAWVHANNTHLWTNLFSLALLAEILGQSFSNKTLSSVAIAAALIGAVLGSLGKEFSVIIGASGAIMGLFGFLFAAQNRRDERLNPLVRVPRQKALYLVLCVEFFLSLRYPWYGGFVHLAGVGTGYAMYYLFEPGDKRRWHNRTQLTILVSGLVLFMSWAAHTFQYFQQPDLLIRKAYTSEDPFQIMLANTALPDLPDASENDVRAARERSIELLPTNSLFNWPIARADYWLGDYETALRRLRPYSAEESGSAEIRELWLAVERDHALQSSLGQPETYLPQGPATAYLMNTEATLFARIKLPDRISPVAAAIQSAEPIAWQLIAVTDPIEGADEETYGVWSIPKTKFRTALTANLVEGTTP